MNKFASQFCTVIAPEHASDPFIKTRAAKKSGSRQHTSLVSLVMAMSLVAGLGVTSLVQADGATNDVVACYKWDQFPRERLNLGIRNGGPLSASTESLVQRTHGVHGKHVGSCGRGTNAAVVGVLVFQETVGTHLGLYSAQSRGEEKFNGDDHCRSMSIECTSDEVSRAPTSFTCQSRNEFGDYHGESTLTLVALDSAPDDPFCGVFEDKDDFEDSNEEGSGVASGLRSHGKRSDED